MTRTPHSVLEFDSRSRCTLASWRLSDANYINTTLLLEDGRSRLPIGKRKTSYSHSDAERPKIPERILRTTNGVVGV